MSGEIVDDWRTLRERNRPTPNRSRNLRPDCSSRLAVTTDGPMFAEKRMTLVTSVFGLAALLGVLAALPAQAACPFAQIPVEVGMSRMDLEVRIASLLGKTNTYSPYGNNLRGGTFSYPGRDCALRVTFASGVPAPRVDVAGGGSDHLQPIDETVLSHEVVPTSAMQRH